MLKGVSDGEE